MADFSSALDAIMVGAPPTKPAAEAAAPAAPVAADTPILSPPPAPVAPVAWTLAPKASKPKAPPSHALFRELLLSDANLTTTAAKKARSRAQPRARKKFAAKPSRLTRNRHRARRASQASRC